MTTTAVKTTVEAKWSPTKVQEETARVMAGNCMAAFQVLSKYGEQAVKEYQDAARQYKVNYLKNAGVKTPLELAKASAELEANLFGSKIEIAGDDKSATATYKACGMWNALQKVGNLTPEQQEKMGANFENCVQTTAKEFNFKADVHMEGDTCTVTYTK